MVSEKEIQDACPALVWAQHRFQTEIQTGAGKLLVVRFDIPTVDKPWHFTAHSVAEQFADALGDSAMDPEVCLALADLLNQRVKLVASDVSLHLRLTYSILDALSKSNLLLAHILLQALADSLLPYAGQLWLYEWPEWVTLVEKYIAERADKQTLKIIEKMRRHF